MTEVDASPKPNCDHNSITWHASRMIYERWGYWWPASDPSRLHIKCDFSKLLLSREDKSPERDCWFVLFHPPTRCSPFFPSLFAVLCGLIERCFDNRSARKKSEGEGRKAIPLADRFLITLFGREDFSSWKGEESWPESKSVHPTPCLTRHKASTQNGNCGRREGLSVMQNWFRFMARFIVN